MPEFLPGFWELSLVWQPSYQLIHFPSSSKAFKNETGATLDVTAYSFNCLLVSQNRSNGLRSASGWAAFCPSVKQLPSWAFLIPSIRRIKLVDATEESKVPVAMTGFPQEPTATISLLAEGGEGKPQGG